MKIVEYDAAEYLSNSLDVDCEFELDCNSRLKEGFQPFGSPVAKVTPFYDYDKKEMAVNYHYFQAFVKYED